MSVTKHPRPVELLAEVQIRSKPRLLLTVQYQDHITVRLFEVFFLFHQDRLS